MIIDFTEIPQANVPNGQQDKFELFAREFLNYMGYRIIEEPSRGADGGKDLVVDEHINLIGGVPYTIRWLVSCKHYAHSGKSVSDGDELNVKDRVEQHHCDGFIGFYSTLPSTGLENRLRGVTKTNIYDAEKIERFVVDAYKDSKASTLFVRFFPKSWKEYCEMLQMNMAQNMVVTQLPIKNDAPVAPQDIHPFSNDHKKELDVQTVTDLFTYFSTYLMDDYLRQDPENIDTRIVLICDCWDAMIGASSFIIYNPVTNKVVRDFYEPFSELIHEGGKYYGPHDINPHMYHFYGYEHDEFISVEKERKFYDFARKMQELYPLYNRMMEHVKNEYPLNLAKMSEEFQKANS